MVRQKQHIYTDGKVKEGEIYNVKWGTSEASSSDGVIKAMEIKGPTPFHSFVQDIAEITTFYWTLNKYFSRKPHLV
jgi:hypothetical protein